MAADTKLVRLELFSVQMFPIDLLREQLAAQGLHVVTAADKAVLDACEHVPGQQLRFTRFNGGYLGAVAVAELARRGAK